MHASRLSFLTRHWSSLWRYGRFLSSWIAFTLAHRPLCNTAAYPFSMLPASNTEEFPLANPALLQTACSTASNFYCFILRSTTNTFTLSNRALLQLLCDMTAKSFSLFPPSDIEACSVANRAQVQPISGMNFNWFQLPVRCKTEPFQLQTELEDAARSKGANNQSNRTSSSTLHDQHR